jgi:acrylyl-CoA reductase (NADPH)
MGTRAFVVKEGPQGFTAQVEELDELMAGSVTVRVAYSAVNYKDGLAAIPDGKVVRSYPMVPGIDLSGVVESSEDPRFSPGDEVLATGYDLGVSHFGGFAARARLPAEWVLPLPRGLTLREAMILGTAGFTAALALERLMAVGLTPEGGPVLVTGATGGVGSLAVAILAKAGYEVEASTGKAEAHPYLRALGARAVLPRESLTGEDGRALARERWQGAIDSVGGTTLANVLKATRREGAVASVGLAGGNALHTTVYPFILRGVSLLGIDSAYTAHEVRQRIWRLLAGEWKPEGLERMVAGEVTLEGLSPALRAVLAGQVRGRTLVRP